MRVMRNFILVFILVHIHYCFVQAQVSLTVPSFSNSSSIQSKTQKEIDEIRSPAEGVIFLNSTSKCFNYYVAGSWYELCGNCLPRASAPIIDSIHYSLNAAIVFLRKPSTAEYYALLNGKEKLSSASNPLLIQNIGSEKTTELKLYAKNTCGLSDPITIELKNSILFKEFDNKITDTRSSRTYSYVQISNLYWLCDDLVFSGDKNNTLTKNEISYQNYTVASTACPTGWRLPTKPEVEHLATCFSTIDSSFYKQVEFSKLNFAYNGVIDPSNKQVYGKGSNHYLWTSTSSKADQSYFLNVGSAGFVIMETNKSALMNVRCVKDVE